MSEQITLQDKKQALKLAYQIVTDKRNNNRYMFTSLASKDSPEIFTYFDMLRVLNGMYKELEEAPVKLMQKPLTLEELTKSAYQIPCWIEGVGIKETEVEVLDRDSNGLFGVLFLLRQQALRSVVTWTDITSRGAAGHPGRPTKSVLLRHGRNEHELSGFHPRRPAEALPFLRRRSCPERRAAYSERVRIYPDVHGEKLCRTARKEMAPQTGRH